MVKVDDSCLDNYGCPMMMGNMGNDVTPAWTNVSAPSQSAPRSCSSSTYCSLPSWVSENLKYLVDFYRTLIPCRLPWTEISVRLFWFHIFSKPSRALAPSCHTCSLGTAGTMSTLILLPWLNCKSTIVTMVLQWLHHRSTKGSTIGPTHKPPGYQGLDHNLMTSVGFRHVLLFPITCPP